MTNSPLASIADVDTPHETPSTSIRTPMLLQPLGRRAYESCWRLQREQLERRLADRCPDTLMLVEHDPVFTIGRRTREEHWRSQWSTIEAKGIPCHHVDRGGSVTYHGPGQLVGYPILRLRPPFSGPRLYVQLLEETLLRTAADFGIAASRREGLHGVWVMDAEGPMKLAAVGVRLVRGVTMHGFALNVSVDLQPFDWIVPCGILRCRTTSLSALSGRPLTCDAVSACLTSHFASLFGVDWMATDTCLSSLEGPQERKERS